MPAIISNELRILNSDAFLNSISNQPSYLFIGKNTEWDDEEIPDTLYGNDIEKINIYKDLLAVKRIPTDAGLSVIPRINWALNFVYDAYDHRINMVDGRKTNGEKYVFYVVTDEFNVYKCIHNNNGANSTTKPTSTQVTPFQTPDGYIWKFMYTLKSTDVFNYMNANWIPVYTLDYDDGSIQWTIQQAAIDGGIHAIDIDNVGAGYSSLTPPTITITGDGVGAEAICFVDQFTGTIKNIIITDPGEGYTTATVAFINTFGGVGASATAILSPIGGHGKDARAELGGTNKMIRMVLTGTEGGTFPVTTFRQAGLIRMPLSNDLGSKLTLNSTNGFNVGDTVTGGTSNTEGEILVKEDNNKVIWVSGVVGDYVQSESISNGTVSSSASRVENDINLPLVDVVAATADVVINSGKLLYVSNRIYISRTTTGNQEIRFVIQF